MTKVLIVEDHASMRESLAVALTAAGDFSDVYKRQEGKHYLCYTEKTAICLTPKRMPLKSGWLRLISQTI